MFQSRSPCVSDDIDVDKHDPISYSVLKTLSQNATCVCNKQLLE